MRKTLIPILLALLLAGLCLMASCAQKNKEDLAPAPADQSLESPAVSGVSDTPDPSEEESDSPDQPVIEPESTDGPLTGEELKYFNQEFFNGDDMNIRNQFLSSVYETPADINLLELFYCGTGQDEAMTDEEWADFEAAGGFVDIDVTKVSAAGADAVLLEHTGLTLAETKQAGLDGFTYLPDYDAYYLAHGDTNYRGYVEITSGRREGELIHLYYEDTFMADGWKCVTLRPGEDGGYKFVSNVRCDPADVPGT